MWSLAPSSAPQSNSFTSAEKPRKSRILNNKLPREKKVVPPFPLKAPRYYHMMPNTDPRYFYPSLIIDSLGSGNIGRFREVMKRLCAADVQFLLEYDCKLCGELLYLLYSCRQFKLFVLLFYSGVWSPESIRSEPQSCGRSGDGHGILSRYS